MFCEKINYLTYGRNVLYGKLINDFVTNKMQVKVNVFRPCMEYKIGNQGANSFVVTQA